MCCAAVGLAVAAVGAVLGRSRVQVTMRSTVVRSRSWARRVSGAVVITLRIWLTACVRDLTAEARAFGSDARAAGGGRLGGCIGVNRVGCRVGDACAGRAG